MWNRKYHGLHISAQRQSHFQHRTSQEAALPPRGSEYKTSFSSPEDTGKSHFITLRKGPSLQTGRATPLYGCLDLVASPLQRPKEEEQILPRSRYKEGIFREFLHHCPHKVGTFVPIILSSTQESYLKHRHKIREGGHAGTWGTSGRKKSTPDCTEMVALNIHGEVFCCN